MCQFDKLPSYYVFAGLVFLPSTPQPGTIPKKAGEQIVLLSQVLEDETTVGYTFLNNSRVTFVLESCLYYNMARDTMNRLSF